MIVVSDASPLISLAVIGHLELLKHLYERVLIPDAVYQELTAIVPDSKEWNEILRFFATSFTLSYLMWRIQSLGVRFSAVCGRVVPGVV